MSRPFPIPDTYLAIDFETTGRNPRDCGIVEVAVARVSGGVVVDSWTSLANPGRPCDEGAFAAHGITGDEIAAAPPLADVMAELLFGWLLNGLPLVAYNGDTFDRIVLQANAAACGVNLPDLTWHDPLPMARAMLPGRGGYKLGQVGAAVGVLYTPGELHRAAADTRLLVGIVEALRRLPAPSLPAPVVATEPAAAEPAPWEITPAGAPVPAATAAGDVPELQAKAQAALAPLAGRIAKWIAAADALPCATDADEVRVIDAMATFRKLSKETVALRLRFTEEIGKQKAAIEADFRTHALKPIDAVILRLEELRRPMALARATAAAAERAAAEREAEAIAMAERQRILDAEATPATDAALEAALAGAVDDADRAVAIADTVLDAANAAADRTYDAAIASAAAIAPAPVRGFKATATDRIVWLVTVTSPRLVPSIYCSPDVERIAAAIAAANGEIVIPGVEFVADVATSTRGHRGA
jgi:DNA polymerase III epsilon subunit-like protein